jgi:2-hydroxy-3-oxopropionate reductase
MAEKIGFVGLGIMGRPMSKNLLKAGYDITAYDIVAAALDDVVAAGAKKGTSAKDVASRTDIIITMLPDGPDVEKVVLGPNGVLEGAKKGAIVVDMSSISPIVAKKVGAECAKKGVEFLDSPVSGGEPGAINATLAIMVGGKKEVFEKVKAILGKMGSTVTLTGDVGAGNVTKLANQIMVAVNIAGVSEALVLATKAGLDPEVVFNAVKAGLAGSNVLNAKGPMMIARNFKPGFRIRLHQKDLRNTLQTAEALGIPLPITAYCQQMFNALMNEGKGDNDHSGLVQYLEKAASVTVKKPGT